jgi:hypothetical protein
MRMFDTHWERLVLALSNKNLRVGLAVLSLVAFVLGGAADEGWN